MNRRASSDLPPISQWRLRLFHHYVQFYLRRNFHSFYLSSRVATETLTGWPLLICMNHPSWWDPLLALHLSQRLFPERKQYAPIASEALAKYKFFEHLGFFGIDPFKPGRIPVPGSWTQSVVTSAWCTLGDGAGRVHRCSCPTGACAGRDRSSCPLSSQICYRPARTRVFILDRTNSRMLRLYREANLCRERCGTDGFTLAASIVLGSRGNARLLE